MFNVYIYLQEFFDILIDYVVIGVKVVINKNFCNMLLWKYQRVINKLLVKIEIKIYF